MTESETKREQIKTKRKQTAFKVISCVLLFIVFTIYGTIKRNAPDASSGASEQSVSVQHSTIDPEASEEPSGSVPATSVIPSETVGVQTVDTSDLLDLQYTGDIAVQVDLSPDDEMLAGFSDDEITLTSFESYSELDALGRPGTAYACLGQDLMPDDGEERGSISSVTPPGWIQNRYPGTVGRSNGYLYERCHLIAWSLAGENANPLNLITGTGYFNYDGMLLVVEEPVLDYIDNTGNHVMYRVTPVYDGDNLIANGVLMEAWSVEDNGSGINLCFYIFNVQPGITIDYATGENWCSVKDQE